MDFLITGFLLWIYNLLFSESANHQNNDDTEQGAAFFFGSKDFQDNCNSSGSSKKVNDDYDDGPNW